jgi:filamentous hemagglutinin family protein
MKSWNHSALPLVLRTIAIASPLAAGLIAPSVLAQSTNPSIVPASDGTGTQIIPNGNRLDISGGQLSGDRANLFHSFTRFGLTETQIANFLSNPEIRTIFARISGGEPSLINGVLQVSGSNANLFLMNPAGIVFGQTASLNVPAAFTATTANGIGFGDRWWSAVGNNDYAALNGMPSRFAFTMPQPGAIVNAGNLAVVPGQAIGLLGGTVVNTGQLSAPGGSVVVAAVSGNQFVELSQPGSLLSFRFAVAATDASQPQPIAIPIASLPQLLTGGNLASATGLIVNANGQVELVGSGQQLLNTAGSTSIAGSINTDGQTGGQIAVVGDRVGLYNATLSATGIANGGTVLVGGEYQGKGNIPNATQTYVNPSSTIHVDSLVAGNGGRAIVWADDTTAFYGTISGRGGANGGFAEVSGKQNLVFRGSANLGATNGSPGTLLLDPTNILISNGSDPGTTILQQDLQDPTQYPGNTNLILEATNNIQIGTLDIVDLARTSVVDNRNALQLAEAPNFGSGTAGSVTFRADSDNDGVGSFLMTQLAPDGRRQVLQATGRNISISGATIVTGDIDTSFSNGKAGDINLSSNNNITTGELRATHAAAPLGEGGNIVINAGGGFTLTGSIASFSNRGGSDIKITAKDSIVVNCTIARGACVQSSAGGLPNSTPTGNSGNILFTSLNGGIRLNQANNGAGIPTISSSSTDSGATGSAGSIELKAKGDIVVGNISSGANFNAGNISLISIQGSINTSAGILNTSSANQKAGDLSLNSAGSIVTGNLVAFSTRGDAGSVALSSSNSAVTTTDITTSSGGSNGRAGNISIVSQDDITISRLTASPNGLGQFGNLGFAGNISLVSQRGSINTISGNSSGDNFGNPNVGIVETGNSNSIVPPDNLAGGVITFQAYGDIRTGNIDATGQQHGGTVNLISLNGAIDTRAGLISTSSPNGSGGAGGDITFTAAKGIFTGDLVSSGGSSGGNITLIAPTQITTGNINTSATIGNGGNVFLDPLGDIQVTSINAQGGTAGLGGNVDITTQQFFRATNVFSDRNGINASISASGGAGGGTIIIRHGGGDRSTPFIVGNASVNGTAGAITTNNNAILPSQSFPGIYWQFGPSGDIGIITSEPRPPQEILVKPLDEEDPSDDNLVYTLEERFTREYEDYFGKSPNCNIKGLREVQATLKDIANKTNLKPGAIYVFFDPLVIPDRVTRARRTKTCDRPPLSFQPSDNDVLRLLLVTPEGKPIPQPVSSATHKKVMQAVKDFQKKIFDSDFRRTTLYEEPSRQFYEWLIVPLQAEIQARGIKNLVFVMDQGLRTLPLAALYDGKRHLIETYSVGLMPSFTNANTEYGSLQKARVLAGGISKFSTQNELPAVEVELDTIQQQWLTQILREAEVTPANLKQARLNYPYEMIHLATHAKFVKGPPDQSLIVLKNEQQTDQSLTLEDISQMGWSKPPTELLVLSACQTALGDKVDLGFAGIAFQSGVKSVLASLWKIEDASVPPLMAEYYYWLSRVSTKAEALRLAQLGLLQKKVFVHYQRLKWSGGEIPLPANIQVSPDLSYPYYWAGFTIVGSPW